MKNNSAEQPNPVNGKWKVLIVDDHEVVREGLANLIGEDTSLEVCGGASDAATALEIL